MVEDRGQVRHGRLEELLAQPLIVAAAPVPGARAPPPSLRLKSLALKNLGTILQRRGEAARALDRLLDAPKAVG